MLGPEVEVKVKGDRVQLQQVLLNLMMNGMDAMNGTAGANRELIIRSRAVDSHTIMIAVEDSGTGLDSEAMENIFHPFFTTKPNGIGMGLSISRSIVESHQGRLWATSRPEGAAFQFTLPVELSNPRG